MDRELACEIVKDLLPLYVDEMVSDVSKKSIEKHLKHCAACSEIHYHMTWHLEMETQPPELGDVKRFLKKTKKMYFLYVLVALSFIAMLVCLIVDLAVNKGITWSLIVGSSCLFADVFVYVLATYKKKKDYIAAMAVMSIGAFALLSVIQITLYYLMDIGSVWIFRYGFPILVTWLLALWLPLLVRKFLKWNIWDCLALFLLFTIAGNYVTKLIIGDYAWNDVLHMKGFLENALGEVLGIILLVIIGRVKKWRK